MVSVCSAPDCGRKYFANGYCQMHGARVRRHGSTERLVRICTKSEICTLCGNPRTEETYYSNRTGGRCKRCLVVLNTCRKFGIAIDRYFQVLASQENACAICRNPFGSDAPNLDHDHETGEPRGFVCHICNFLLIVLDRATENTVSAGFAYLKNPPFGMGRIT